MKTIIAISVLCCFTFIMKAQDVKSTSCCNIGVGGFIGNSTSGNSSTIYGFSLQGNNIFKENILLGLCTDVGSMFEKGYNSGSGIDTGNVIHSDITGTYLNFFAAATYYFLGNAIKSKAGLFGVYGPISAVVRPSSRNLTARARSSW